MPSHPDCRATLGLLGGQKPLPVNLRNRAETCRRVHAWARHVPLSRKIEDVAQKHQDVIGGSSSISLGPHVVDQPRYVLARNLVEGKTTEGREDVDAQECFVGGPTPLAGLGMGQVAVADELVERRDGPQFLATSLRVATKQRLGERRAAGAFCLPNREDASRPELELTLPATPVDISLIEGFAPGGSDFKQEALLLGVEEINLRAAPGAEGIANKLRTERMRGHEQTGCRMRPRQRRWTCPFAQRA
jgi:hypothetical protein